MPSSSRLRLLKGVYAFIALLVLYFVSGFFMGFSIHGCVNSNVYNVVAGVNGYIQKIYVADNQLVKKGDLLLSIDPTPFALQVNATQAAVEQAKVQLQLAKTNTEKNQWALISADKKLKEVALNLMRYEALAKRGFYSKEGLDKIRLQQELALAAFKEAQLQLQTANNAIDLSEKKLQEKIADYRQAQYQLSLTKIYASETGYVTHLINYQGDYIEAQSSLFGLVDNVHWYVTGYYFQNELRHIKPGQTVWLHFDSDPWRLYTGEVENISRGVARDPEPGNVSLSYREPVMGWLTNNYYYPVRIKIHHPEKIPLFVNSDVRTLIFY